MAPADQGTSKVEGADLERGLQRPCWLHLTLCNSSQLKTQMWHLLKGHHHLQDEFSVFFDHLRPAASRMGDFEEINWTEEKEYEFDGFEEVALPDVEEEEEAPKTPTASKSRRRKEIGAQSHDKVDSAMGSPCS